MTRKKVHMYHANWCGFCQKIMPHIKNHPRKAFIKIMESEVQPRGHFEGFPTFHFLQDDRVVDTHVGANAREFDRKLEVFLGGASPDMNAMHAIMR